MPASKLVFSHAGSRVEGTHDGAFGYDWTAVLCGVLIAKGRIRGDDIEAHDAIVAFITALDFEQHVSKTRHR